jgi:hypothetical protein
MEADGFGQKRENEEIINKMFKNQHFVAYIWSFELIYSLIHEKNLLYLLIR